MHNVGIVHEFEKKKKRWNKGPDHKIVSLLYPKIILSCWKTQLCPNFNSFDLQ